MQRLWKASRKEGPLNPSTKLKTEFVGRIKVTIDAYKVGRLPTWQLEQKNNED